MSDDTVELLVNGRRISNFLSYSLEADLYTADDAFSLELADPEAPVTAGMRCEVRVNDTLELTGIIDRTIRHADKSGKTLRVEGRDLMGLLVDSYCEQFVTVAGKTVKQLAEQLLKTVPYINRRQIIYQENIVGKLKGKKKTVDNPLVGFMDTPQKLSQIEPGMTVFEVLRTYGMSRGLMFYALPDGTMVFGRPRTGGGAAFSIALRKDGKGNNVSEGDYIEDLSKRYSQVTVITQQQGFDLDAMDTTKINAKATVKDPDFPFYKPYVTKLNNDSQAPKLHGRLLLERMRHEGFQLSYKAPGHSQGGVNWWINELAQVDDDINKVSGLYLIYGRTFVRSKQEGTYTKLRLGLPGLVA